MRESIFNKEHMLKLVFRSFFVMFICILLSLSVSNVHVSYAKSVVTSESEPVSNKLAGSDVDNNNMTVVIVFFGIVLLIVLIIIFAVVPSIISGVVGAAIEEEDEE